MSSVQVTVTGDKALDRFFRKLPGKLQRGAIRKGVRAGGTVLAKRIRANVKSMVGRKTGNLARSIKQRPWSLPQKGLIGTVVGPTWPEGAHGHLVEFGHAIVVNGVDTGRRTRPIPFQRTANRQSKDAILAAQKKKLTDVLGKLKAK